MQMPVAAPEMDIPADAGLHNIEAEQALLGSLLVTNNMLDRITERLVGGHFYDPLHGRIFDIIDQRIRNGHGVSAVTLKNHFASDPAMLELGGPRYLVRLTDAAISVSNAPDYARTVYELALRRLLTELGDRIRQDAGNGAFEMSAEELIEKIERELYLLAEEGRVEKGFQPLSALMGASIKQAERACKNPGNVGLPTGLSDLDRVIGGLQNSDLVIIAGRTAMGKSALASHIAFSAARHTAEDRGDEDGRTARGETNGSKRRRGILYFSLEMSAVQLTTRILAGQTGIPSQNIARGRLSENEFGEFVRVANNLSELPLYLDDTPAMNIATLCTRARRMKRQVGIAAIFIDYLQLIESSRRGENRVQQVTEVSQRLKGLAKELDVPVIALAQLSRQVESRDSKQPQLSDLRESGSIEQDADIVALLHRDEYYLERDKPSTDDPVKRQEWESRMEQVMNIAQLHIAKHRNGPTDTIRLHFDRHHTTFSNLRENDPMPSEIGNREANFG